MAGTLFITGDTASDKLLNTNANALLLGMLLDQQVPMEWAFAGPSTLRQRLGHPAGQIGELRQHAGVDLRRRVVAGQRHLAPSVVDLARVGVAQVTPWGFVRLSHRGWVGASSGSATVGGLAYGHDFFGAPGRA